MNETSHIICETPPAAQPGIHVECPLCRSFTFIPQTQLTSPTFDCEYCHHTCNTDPTRSSGR
ncbi:hypothetical protein [Rhodococcus sp. H-CA8f]|uniref:hypothetical protein n=1 Tax=Rhodococcus sp. H-CA8f TaxID=1727214 RepID=UPI0012FF86AF|nr:hypothetical protein [Rhodococcus sp. H-CA8f]